MVGDVFDVVSFLAVKWSYSALRAFGIVVGLVLLFAQLLVLDARRRSRQAAFVLTRPMGASVRGESVAVLTELALPFVTGVVLAVPLSIAVLHVAVPRFDTLRQLPPPARVVLVPETFLGAIGVGAGGAHRTRRDRGDRCGESEADEGDARCRLTGTG